MLILALLAGCVRDAPLPDLGPCAVYPDGVYEYGQVGIGTCLAGPTDLQFAETDDGETILLVTNANPYQVFTGGSLLSIPWASIDQSTGRNRVDTLSPVAVDLPTFTGPMTVAGDLGIITTRLSEDARVRQTFDDLYLVDLADPSAPVPSDRGQDGSWRLTVQSDPVDVVHDPESGRAFVANRTSHSVTILDLSGDTIEIELPWPSWALTTAAFDDDDRSGSRADLDDLAVLTPDAITDDEWTLTWVEGTARLWLPDGVGAARVDSPFNGVWTASPLGAELDPTLVSVIDTVEDPHFAGTRMVFADGGDIRGALSEQTLVEWQFEANALLTGRPGAWDATLGGPALTADDIGYWLFYDGGGQTSPGIGVALSGDAVVWTRLTDAPVLTPAEGEAAIADPYVFYDEETDQWRMFHSTWDGARWAVAEATSADLVTWTASSTLALEVGGGDAAAPVVAAIPGGWRMWFSRRVGDTWHVGEATSADGRSWTDQGEILAYDPITAVGDEPPGVALDASLTSAFRVEGEDAGVQGFPAYPGVLFGDEAGGWLGTTLAGYHLAPGDAGAASTGGIRVDSVDTGTGRAWLTLINGAGRPSIGVATLDTDGSLLPDSGAVFTGRSAGFDRDGADTPVVVEIDGTWHLYYAGTRGAVRTIGLLTSTDGETWEPQGRVLDVGTGFDVGGVEPGSVEILDNGSVRLWYSGFDGEAWRIGSATSPNGKRFTREPATTRDYQFGQGSPGQWHDSGTRHPWAVRGADPDGNPGLHLWFTGFDGDTWRGGYAFRPDGAERFTVAEDEATLEPRATLDTTPGLFHPDGIERPVFVPAEEVTGEAGWTGWFSGIADAVPRVGAASGLAPDRLATTPLRPTVGDTLTFSTERGDPDAQAIPLDRALQAGAVSGIGLIALSLDTERGYLYAISKLLGYLVVIDIRDDSGPAFRDLNYLDIEAVLPFNGSGGAQGFRQVVPVPGTDRLYAVNDQPEAIWVLDISDLEDEAFAHIVTDTAVGWLPAPRGLERDQGPTSQSSVGPAQMAVHPDGRRLFLTNFNANSLTVYDLELGPHGSLVAEVPLLGESPYGLAISPDGSRAVVANFAGEVTGRGLVESTLAIVDIDESSPTYLEVLTWVTNR